MNKSKITIVGFDPSLANTGMVAMTWPDMKVIEKHTASTSPSKNKSLYVNSDMVERIKYTIKELRSFISRHDPVFIFSELPSGAQSYRAAVSVGFAFSIIALHDAIYEDPKTVKKKSVGHATASKREVISWASKLHPEAGWDMRSGKIVDREEHAADSIAIIYACLDRPEVKAALKAFN